MKELSESGCVHVKEEKEVEMEKEEEKEKSFVILRRFLFSTIINFVFL